MKIKKRKSADVKEFSITGKVIYVNVKGYGPNSAQITFAVQSDKGEKQAILVGAPPAYESEVFTSMAHFVSLAYFLGKPITAGYYKVDGGTNQAIEVYSPQSKKK